MRNIEKRTQLEVQKRFNGITMPNTSLKSFKNPFILTAVLYLVASVCQIGWLYILFQYFDQVKRWIEGIPFLGWMMAIIFIGIAVMVPLLFIIGLRLLRLIKKAVKIEPNYDQIRKRKAVNMLLTIGIFADLFFTLFLIFTEIKDRSAIPFAVALFGGRVLQANFEAVVLYFSVKNNKQKQSKEIIKTG